MPGVYKCTWLPTTHFPPIVPTLEGHDDPCIISVHHPRLHALYKSIGNYHLGLLFPDTQQGRGLGSDLDLGVTSTVG